MSVLVIVTGGSAGIGAALLAAAPEGSDLVSFSRSAGAAPEHGARHVSADLSSEPGLTDAVREIAEIISTSQAERIVLVHNAAGLTPTGFTGEISITGQMQQAILDAVAPQVIGAALLAAVSTREVRAQLLQITSGAARGAYPGWAVYCASKAAVDMWVRTVGLERQQRGDTATTVFAVAPGVVATDMQAVIRDTPESDFPAVERFQQMHDEGALSSPDDVAVELWRLLDLADAGSIENGTVLDIRDLPESLRA